MNSLHLPVHALYQMVRADFLERTRRYSFLLTLGFSLWLGYMVYSGQVNLLLGQYKGQPNSAWTGSVIALVATVWLSLIGFYVVKNSLQRDRETGVGLILATTPMSRIFYTFAKALSNFAVLALMILVLAAAALVIQLALQFRGGFPVELVPLLAPVLILGLCAVALSAALAVLFETLPVLRTGVGNILYFFLWTFLLSLSAIHMAHYEAPNTNGLLRFFSDYTGLASIMTQMQSQVHALDPLNYQGGSSFSVGDLTRASQTFLWTGVHWTPAILLSRAFWIVVAIELTALSALFFDRFDPARFDPARFDPARFDPARSSARLRLRSQKLPPPPALNPAHIAAASTRSQINVAHLTPVAHSQSHTRFSPLVFLQLVRAEFRLMARGHTWWWYLVASGLILASLFAPIEASSSGILLAAWLWPTLLWSQMGTREARFSTGPLLFSAPNAFPRQLLATWVAGLAVAAITGSGLALRYLILQDWSAFTAWTTAVAFIPALALTLGVLTESRKPFEALYVAWWYTGPLHHIPKLDFMATTPQSATPAIYATATAALLLTACLWRILRRRLA